MRFLVQSKADVNAAFGDGKTSLFWASQKAHAHNPGGPHTRSAGVLRDYEDAGRGQGLLVLSFLCLLSSYFFWLHSIFVLVCLWMSYSVCICVCACLDMKADVFAST